MAIVPPFVCEPIRIYDGDRLVEAGVLWGERRADIGRTLAFGNTPGPISRYRAIVFTHDDRTVIPMGLKGEEQVRIAPRYRPSAIQSIESERRQPMEREAYNPSIVNFISTEGDRTSVSGRMYENEAFKLAWQLNKALDDIRTAVDGEFARADPDRPDVSPALQAQLAAMTNTPSAKRAKRSGSILRWLGGLVLLVVAAVAVSAYFVQQQVEDRKRQRLEFAQSMFSYLDTHPSVVIASGGCPQTIAALDPSMPPAERKAKCNEAWGDALKVGYAFARQDWADGWLVSTDLHAGSILWKSNSRNEGIRPDGRTFLLTEAGTVIPATR